MKKKLEYELRFLVLLLKKIPEFVTKAIEFYFGKLHKIFESRDLRILYVLTCFLLTLPLFVLVLLLNMVRSTVLLRQYYRIYGDRFQSLWFY